MELFDELERALGIRDGKQTAAVDRAGIRGIVGRIARGEGAMVPAVRADVLFDLADWLWDESDRDAALQATVAALKVATEGHLLDPATLSRRLDRLAERLEIDGHHTMAAEVWKLAIDMSMDTERDHGDALRWRLERYLAALRRIGAPQAQIEAVQERLFQLPEREPLTLPEPTPRTVGGPPPPAASPPPPPAAPAPAARRSEPMPEAMPVPELETARKPMAAPQPFDDRQRTVALGYHRVPVHFATHRAVADASNPYDTFGCDASRGQIMTFGVVHVTVPLARRIGELPVQGWIASQFWTPDPAQYLTIEAVDLLSHEACFSSLTARVAGSQRKEVLVFVHGFNNTFTDAALRCAQLAVDLDIDGVPVLYSWPSVGAKLGFIADRDRVRNRKFQDDFRAFLIEVIRRSGATHIHLVAHSMGSQLALSSLAGISETEIGSLRRERVALARARSADRSPVALADVEARTRILSEVIFASPDVDREQFRPDIQKVTELARRTTLYTSKVDIPLRIASVLSNGPRAGLDASALADIKGLACIDTTQAPDDWLAHGSFASRAIDDIQGIVWLSLDPSMRKRLVRKAGPSGYYWEYDPAAKVDLYARAVELIRRFGFAGALRQPEVAAKIALKTEIEQLQSAQT